jgi:hypothetical protein
VVATAEVSPAEVTNAGVTNAGVTNAGVTNAGVTNAGVTNAGVTNAGVTHAGVTNAGVTNAGVTNAGVTNAGVTNAGVTSAVLSMVEQFRSVPAVPLLEAAPQQYLLFGLTNGHSSAITESSVAVEEDPAVAARETINSVVRPLVESAKAAPGEVKPSEVAPVEAAPPIALLNLPAVAPRSEPTSLESVAGPAALSSPPTFVELAAPPIPPEMAARLSEPPNRTAALPPAIAPAPAAEPNPFLARVAQIADLRIPARSVPKTAARVKSGNLPAPEAPAATPQPKTEPAGLPVPAIKLMDLAIPHPAVRTAPRIEEASNLAPRNLAIAPPPAQTGPTPFPAPGVQITGLAATQAAHSENLAVKFAPLVHATALNAAPPAAPALRVEKSAPFATAKPQLPKLAVAPEPFCAAVALANQAGVISKALQLQANAILDEIQLVLDADASKIRRIVATFQERPKLTLLAAPSAIVAAPAPPDLHWMKMPRPVLPARKLSDRKCDSPTAPPQKIPLAGPCLPPELRNFIEAQPAQHCRARKGIGLPAWITSLVIATSLFLVVAVMLQYLETNREARAAVAPAPSQAAAAVPPAPTFEQHPFARFVEVTGLRVVADLNHRSQVQYIVVNHSASQLNGMAIRIAVRSSTDPVGAPPLFTVSAVVPSLGPHQSKEIRTDLDSELRSSAIPDWEYLRTDVQIGSQN